MKTLFIGDSHLASLRSSMSADEVNEFTFFACSSAEDMNMGMLAIENQRLVPTNENLKSYFQNLYKTSQIDLNCVDLVVLVGLRLEFPYKLIEETFCSNQVLLQSMMDLITEQSITFNLTKKIRKLNESIDIAIIPNPLISTHLKSLEVRTAPGITPRTVIGGIKMHSDDMLSKSDDMMSKWQSALDTTFKPYGVHFIFQNTQSITDCIFTSPQYAMNPTNAPGIRHMNAKFWKQMSNQLHGLINDIKLRHGA